MLSKSLIPFIGSKNFEVSRAFYSALGFTEIPIDSSMSLFKIDEQRAFYLQNAYVREWIENTMLFWELDNLNQFHKDLKSSDLTARFPEARISEIKYEVWGKEFFVHDPVGILWHIGEFAD
jgi:hypothetical protein